MEDINKGTLVMIGGAEDKTGDCIILSKVAELSGQREGKIVILTVATEFPSRVGKEYKNLFGRLHVSEIDALHIETREDANDPDRLRRIENATCVFFTGGDQLKITSLIGGTKIDQMLKESFSKRGLVIAGTSAGASAMSEIMITSGDDDEAPKKCTVKMAPGLGLLGGVVIDQHFAQRGRIGRLLSAVAQNPKVLGIGIDEDTAVIVHADDTLEVAGSNAVTILDGINSGYTNVSETNPDEILALTDISLHVLPQGYKYDLKNRIPLIRRKITC
jgi:cyanophycinase